MIGFITKIMALAAFGAFLIALFSYIKTPWYISELYAHFQVQLFIAAGLSLVFVLWIPLQATGAVVFLSLTLILNIINFWSYLDFSRLIPGRDLPAIHITVTDNTLSALQANLFKFNFEHQPMLDLVDAIDPDFVFVYEMTPKWEEALTHLHEEYPYRILQPGNHSHGIGLFSKYPLEDGGLVFMSDSHIPAIQTKANINGRYMDIISLHPRPPTRQDFYENRNQHFEWLIHNIETQSPRPLIVVADLNSTMFAPQYKYMIRKTGLNNAREGRGLQNTWFIHGNLFTGIAIDHFLYNRHISVIYSDVAPPIKSDHLPVVTYFTIND